MPGVREWAQDTEILMVPIYEPLTAIAEIVGIHDSPILRPPVDYQGAREFFQRLCECCDFEEGKALASQFHKGGYQLWYLMHQYAIPRRELLVERVQATEPIDGKPFAVLATIAHEVLDEVETHESEKKPPPPGLSAR
jgi:hypothetical protein